MPRLIFCHKSLPPPERISPLHGSRMQCSALSPRHSSGAPGAAQGLGLNLNLSLAMATRIKYISLMSLQNLQTFGGVGLQHQSTVLSTIHIAYISELGTPKLQIDLNTLPDLMLSEEAENGIQKYCLCGHHRPHETMILVPIWPILLCPYHAPLGAIFPKLLWMSSVQNPLSCLYIGWLIGIPLWIVVIPTKKGSRNPYKYANQPAFWSLLNFIQCLISKSPFWQNKPIWWRFCQAWWGQAWSSRVRRSFGCPQMVSHWPSCPAHRARHPFEPGDQSTHGSTGANAIPKMATAIRKGPPLLGGYDV